MSDSHATVASAASAASALPFVPPSMVVGALGAGVAATAVLAGDVTGGTGNYAVGGAAALGFYVFNRLASVLEAFLSIVKTFAAAYVDGKLPPLKFEVTHLGHVATGDDIELPKPGGHS